jgi:uncharacterized protein YsxB (DUF464 family)
MTKVTIYKNVKNECVGFKALGHAGYAEEGEDIVCAAISILTINTMNAIETFTDADVSLEMDEEIGFIEYRIEEPTKETSLLLDTMVLGLQTMADDENYAEYIDLLFEEV